MIEEELEASGSNIDLEEISNVEGKKALKLIQVFSSLFSLFLKRWIKEVTLD